MWALPPEIRSAVQALSGRRFEKLMSLLDGSQGCALVEPGGPGHLTFCPWATRKSGHPEIYRFRALGSLQFSFEHSLGSNLSAQEEKEGKIFAALVFSATEFLIDTFYKHLIFYNQHFL